MIRRRLFVSGRVQGVWFRDSCREQAARAGVAGWARNLADGRVEVVLEGQPAGVEAVEAWCHRGPRHATVVAVDAADEPPSGEVGFHIR